MQGVRRDLSLPIPRLFLALCSAAGGSLLLLFRSPHTAVGQLARQEVPTWVQSSGTWVSGLSSVTRQLVMMCNAFAAHQPQALGTVAAHPSV